MMIPDKIALIGFMGSGKTTHGRKLARRMGYHFADTDVMIEEKSGKTIAQIFESSGEEGFRNLESEILKETLQRNKLVLSTGGGLPCYGNNMDVLLENFTVIYLDMNTPALASRLLQSKNKNRPVISGFSGDALIHRIHEILQHRLPHYQQAHIQVEGTGLTTDRLMQCLENYTR
jgi:shikimate kinase